MLTREEILQVLREHKPRFAEQYGVTKLGLFGSFARGDATEQSDVDVCVEMPPDFFDLEAIREELETFLQCRVDIVRLRHDLRELFKKRMKRDAIYV